MDPNADALIPFPRTLPRFPRTNVSDLAPETPGTAVAMGTACLSSNSQVDHKMLPEPPTLQHLRLTLLYLPVLTGGSSDKITV